MNKKPFLFLILILFGAGCSNLISNLFESPKIIWGSSTKELQEARVRAVSKVYKCSFDQCYDAVLSLAINEEELEPFTKKLYEVFLKDPIKGIVVVMGIKGNIDTTEVGIFLTELEDNMLEIDIASSSSSAKRKAVDIVFNELDVRFPAKK